MFDAVYLDSLGCAKNQVDSEILLGLLQKRGYLIVEDPQEADTIIVNTCGFIQSAKEEAIKAILTMAQYKETGRCRLLLVTGCLVQRYQKELTKEIPEVDGFFKIGQFHEILSALEQFAPKKAKMPCLDQSIYENRKLLTPPYLAYIRIADGCSNCCSYCAIPAIRGPYRSRPLEEIVREAQKLYADGVKEVVLVAQDTTNYGFDLYGESHLPELLTEIAKIPFLWIRILYGYPERITEKLLQVMAKHNNICPYLDIPLQHSEEHILQAMHRKGNAEELLALLQKCREYIPNIAIRTTFMVGFPGESAADFKNLLSFIKKARFDWAGVFTYCAEDGTPAADRKGQIPEWIKISRRDKTMKLLADISAQKQAARIGQILPVLVEELPVNGSPYYVGRSSFEAPEVDGAVYFTGGKHLAVGDVVQVEITGSDIYDLRGRAVRNEFSK